MPKLGESVTEGTINTWLVKEGDFVNKYDPIAEVMTDKVNAEVPSSFSGTIKEIVVREGETVAVNDLICYIETDEAGVTETNTASESASETEKTETEKETMPENKIRESDKVDTKGARYSTAVIRLATEHGIDLTAVQGTGLGGRITRKDILKVIEEGVPVVEEKIEKKKQVTVSEPTRE